MRLHPGSTSTRPLRYCRTVTVTWAPRSRRAEADRLPISPLPMTRHRFPAKSYPSFHIRSMANSAAEALAVDSRSWDFTRLAPVTAWRNSTSRVPPQHWASRARDRASFT